MSIESDIKRIADGVDKIVAILSNVTVATPTTTTTAIATELKPIEKKQAVDPMEVPTTPEPTEEEIRVAIKELAMKDKPKAIELLVKYGAKAEKPMIKDVTDKTGLMLELKGV